MKLEIHIGKIFLKKVDLNWVLKKGGGFYPSPTCFFRSSIAQDLPSWFQLHSTDDFPLALLAILNGKIGYMDDITACYRVNKGSTSNPTIISIEDGTNIYSNKKKKNISFYESLFRESIIDIKMMNYLIEKEKYMFNYKIAKLHNLKEKIIYVLKCDSVFSKR